MWNIFTIHTVGIQTYTSCNNLYNSYKHIHNGEVTVINNRLKVETTMFINTHFMHHNVAFN